MTPPLYLAELVVWNPATAATTTLRYSTGQGFTTGPGDTPANTYYNPRIKQPAILRRDLFDTGVTQGRNRVGYGDLVLLNGDGELDDLLFYGFDGREITIWRSDTRDPSYPTDFTEVLVGTMMAPLFDQQTVTIKLRDRITETHVPLQTTKYAGNNALPAGLEGVATDLKGKPKPVAYGKVVNAPIPCVNTSKLIYQLNDGAVDSVEGVYDRGIPLGSIFVAVGNNGKLATSNDGVRWVLRDSACGTDILLAVTYQGNLFLVGGANGKLATSSDGETWTTHNSQFGANTIEALVYGHAVYVAVGSAGTLSSSPDGSTWTSRVSQFGATGIYGVAYSPTLDLFVAVGAAGKFSTSGDGVNWTAGGPVAGSPGFLDVVWSVDLALFVATTTSSKVYTSPDGTNWTQQAGASASPTFGIGYGNGLLVAVGQVGATGALIESSPDGVTWTTESHPFTSSNDLLEEANYGGGLWVVVGYHSGGMPILGTSRDGRVWDVIDSPFGADSIRNIAFGALPVTNYANATDLEDDTLAPLPGYYSTYLAGGYVRLGAPPAGLVTSEFTEGDTAADRTAAQIWKRALLAAGFTAPDYSAADITALDAANAAVLGFWTMEEILLSTLLDQCAASVGAWWGADRTGVFRIQRLTDPQLIENGEYEVDTVGSAVVGGSTIARESTYQYRGRYSLKVTTANSADSGVSWTLRSGSKIPATVGDSYTLLVAVYGTGIAIGKTLRLAIGWYTSAPALISTSTQDGNTIVAGWQVFSFSATAPATTATALPQLLTDSIEGIFDVWVDTVQFASPEATFEANDLLDPLQRPTTQDPAMGLPVFQTILRYGRLATVQETDLAGAVTSDRRGYLALEWREAKATDATVQTAHPLAPQTIEETLLTVEADAQTEATRRQTLRGVQRDRFELVPSYTSALVTLDLNAVVLLTHPRYGLDGGKFLRVIGHQPDAAARRLLLSCWG